MALQPCFLKCSRNQESQVICKAKIFYDFVVAVDLVTSHPVALCQLLDLRSGKISRWILAYYYAEEEKLTRIPPSNDE